MRIGIFSDDYLPRDSGVTTSINALYKGLKGLGHTVYILAPKAPGYNDANSDVIRIPSIDPRLFQNVRAALPRRSYIRHILALQLDIVHTETQYSMGILGDYIAKKAGIPHVTTSHTNVPELFKFYPAQGLAGMMLSASLYSFYFGEQLKFSWPTANEVIDGDRRSTAVIKRQIGNLQNMFLNNIDMVMVPSGHARENLLKFGTVAPVVVVPNGIDVDFFNKPRTREFFVNDEIRVVCIGRLSREKRPDYLMKAMVRTHKIKLSIIGEGPQHRELIRLADRLGVADRVTFHGTQDQAFIREQLLSSDILALASYNFDTQGLVLLEAAAAGLPVMYCDPQLSESAAPSSILTGHTISRLRSTFLELESGFYDLEAMSSKARKFAQKFDYKQFAASTLQQYKSLL